MLIFGLPVAEISLLRPHTICRNKKGLKAALPFHETRILKTLENFLHSNKKEGKKRLTSCEHNISRPAILMVKLKRNFPIQWLRD